MCLTLAANYGNIYSYEYVKEDFMGPFEYIITKIEGEYAYLERIDTGDEIYIALALLPFGCDTGTRLLWENFEYSII